MRTQKRTTGTTSGRCAVNGACLRRLPTGQTGWRVGGRRSNRGNVFVELALCLPFLIMMLAGIIQYSMIIHTVTTINEYAREGARYAATGYANVTFANPASNSPQSFQNYMSTICTSSDVPYSGITATVLVNTGTMAVPTWTTLSPNPCSSSCTTLSNGQAFEVTVAYNMASKIYFYGLVPGLPSSWTYTGKYYMVAEQ